MGDGSNIARSTPVLIQENVFRHLFGDAHSVLRYDGALLTWGSGSPFLGELGRSPVGAFYCPTPTVVLDDAVAFTAGVNSRVVLRRDGTVWTWGFGQLGQLGSGGAYAYRDGYSLARMTPMTVFENATQIGWWGWRPMALHSDGSLWAWGSHTDADNNEIFQADVPTMIVRNFVEPTGRPRTFIADDGTEFTFHGWAPQIPLSPFQTTPPTHDLHHTP